MRRAGVLLALILIGAGPPDARVRLADTRREAAAADVRAEALVVAAARERAAARRARGQQRRMAERVAAAAAVVRAAEARVAAVDRRQEAQRARLGTAQAPVARLLAALTDLARRPTIAMVAQPGSLDDLVHVRAVLGAALPQVRARTANVRADMVAIRTLAASAAVAARALNEGRAELDRRVTALATLEARHRREARALSRNAINQSDLALALGERARDLADQMTQQEQTDEIAAELAALRGPTLRPVATSAARSEPIRPVYHLPVRGVLLVGLGEVSPSGVRSRGLTFAVAADAPIRAPAIGTVRYAARFRGYGGVILLDHGGGWISLVTGLARSAVRPGMVVAAGAPLGRAATTDEPRVTVELRRRGRPVDIMAML